MRLSSWKEIAAYVGRDVRTVLRWHKDRGLPVHRAPGARKGSVFAETGELDAWLKSGTTPPAVTQPNTSPAAHARRFLAPVPLIAAAALLGAIAIAIAIAVLEPRPPVASLAIEGRHLVARDAAGAARWARELGITRPTLSAARPYVFADLDGDGRPESIAAIRYIDAAGAPAELLLCVDDAGRERWRTSLRDELEFGAGTFGPPWRAEDLTTVSTPDGPAIAVAVHHDVWWPSFVAVLDRHGAVRDRFVHAGWLTRVERGANGRVLIAAGFSNSRDASVVVGLSTGRMTGHAAEVRGSAFACLNCAGAEPDRYVAFARTEINRAMGRAPIADHLSVRGDGTIVFRVPQDPVQTSLEALYELNPDFSVRRANVSDAYWSAHRRLEHDGLIQHSADACPERKGLAPR